MSASRPRKRGGSEARRRFTAERRDPMLGTLSRNLPIVEPLDPEQVERIDHESMRILEEVGVIFRDPIALEDWKQAGARVDGERVYFDRGHIRELIASIPSNITLHARDPKKTVQLGGPHSIFVPMTGAPYLRDLEDVRRNPTLEDLANEDVLSDTELLGDDVGMKKFHVKKLRLALAAAERTPQVTATTVYVQFSPGLNAADADEADEAKAAVNAASTGKGEETAHS